MVAGDCPASTRGPLSTWEVPRPSFGCTFVAPSGIDGGAVDAGATSDGGASAPCQSLSGVSATGGYQPGWSCHGAAVLHSGASGPIVTFDGGGELAWTGDLPREAQPYIKSTTGDRVQADYQEHEIVVCPFCGGYTTQALEIRDGEGGKVRLHEQSGVVLPNLSDAEVLDIFGASASMVAICSFHAVGPSCTTFDRTEYEHVLATPPAQTIPTASWTAVNSPNGTYQVFWVSSVETNFQSLPNCADGPAPATDTGFVAALTAP